MPAYLTLICHGATSATRTASFPADDPLEDRALERVEALAPYLERADRALSSPARGALQTAESLLLDAIVDPSLRDCDYGRWAGRRIADIQASEPVELQRWLSDLEAAPHGGESLAEVCRRVASWMQARLGEQGTTVAVTHPAVMRASILHALEAPPQAFWRVDIEPLGIVDFSSDGKRWALRMRPKSV